MATSGRPYEASPIHYKFKSMGTLWALAKTTWKSASRPVRAATASGLVAIALALAWVVEQVAGSYVSDWVNAWLLSWMGPILPAIWRWIVTYAMSLIAAVGLLWIAMSLGFWLGLRDPRALVNAPANPDEARAMRSNESQARYNARVAAEGTLYAINTAESTSKRGYAPDRERLRRALEDLRPEISANLALLGRAGVPVPQFTRIDQFELPHIQAYLKEILPFMEKGLFEQAAGIAADQANRINPILESRGTKD